MERVVKAAGIEDIDFNNKYVAIKIHFGEPGNLAFLRPNWAKTLADYIKRLGGRPFLTDCNTLYVGRRNQALAHLDAAMENGYSPLSTGCQNIIADGLRGTDDVEVPVPNGAICKTAFIGRAVMDADIVVSLSHVKGHEDAGFGGAIKNIGMGCGSRAGKMHMHNEGKPVVDPRICKGCKICARFCNHNAIRYGADKKASIDTAVCVGCGRCIGSCSFNAIDNPNGGSNERLNAKMAEYTAAVLSGRPHFHISVINQVSPYCDCHGESDAPIVPDIGIFASPDPVALDKACGDAVAAAPSIKSSILGEREETHGDHFTDVHPTTNWHTQITHAEKIGLGSGSYDLFEVK
jgi:uncharacterized Fe-S center protein